jgi:hypothetical protein
MIWDKKKDMVNMNGAIKANIEVIGKIINYVEKVSMII